MAGWTAAGDSPRHSELRLISAGNSASMSTPFEAESDDLRSAIWAPAAVLSAGALVTFLTRWLVRPAFPDDYDSINFLFGMSRGYDLAQFQPQFPGYPVFVALGHALHGLG